jgi:predicted nuclease with RNAse H fold
MNTDSDAVVAGIDVGGSRKGYHAVALRGKEIVSTFRSRSAVDVAKWCIDQNAVTVGIDAPCKWKSGDTHRLAELQIARAGIFSFWTPTREIGAIKPFYGWMLNGEELYRELGKHYRLLSQLSNAPDRVMFETFPQAVAWALNNGKVLAKNKKVERPKLVRNEGIDTLKIVGIDMVDAALCAITANRLSTSNVSAFGDAQDGLIVIPFWDNPAVPNIG